MGVENLFFDFTCYHAWVKRNPKRKSTHQRKLPKTDYGEPPIAVVVAVAAAVSSLPPPARV